jgi:hypothetical protein
MAKASELRKYVQVLVSVTAPLSQQRDEGCFLIYRTYALAESNDIPETASLPN